MNKGTLVIGAGLAGLTAAWQTAVSGAKVQVIAKGWGATYWHSGCIDLFGFPSHSELGGTTESEALEEGQEDGSLRAGVERLIKERPSHPYALVGTAGIEQALETFKVLCTRAGYPLQGSLEKNWLLPSAAGAIRPTCLAPETMTAGDLRQHGPMLIVGFKQFVDFYPELIADNLSLQGVPAAHLTLDMPELAGRRTMNSVVLTQLMAKESFQEALVSRILPNLGQAERVGFPAVFGDYRQAMDIKAALEVGLGRPIFEIPGLPPSIPGMRLHDILKAAIEKAGGQVNVGMEAVGADVEGGRVSAVYAEAAVRRRAHRYDRYILATGGILGGGIQAGHDGRVREVVFDLPVAGVDGRAGWFGQDFIASDGHPIFEAGIRVDEDFRPIDEAGRPIYDNLYIAGTTLAGSDAIRERAFDGVALVTGFGVGSIQ